MPRLKITATIPPYTFCRSMPAATSKFRSQGTPTIWIPAPGNIISISARALSRSCTLASTNTRISIIPSDLQAMMKSAAAAMPPTFHTTILIALSGNRPAPSGRASLPQVAGDETTL